MPFLGSVESTTSLLVFRSPSYLGVNIRADFPTPTTYLLGRTIPSVRLVYPTASTLLSNAKDSTGISTCCPSLTPFGLGLGPDLPWVDEPSPGILRLSTGEILTHLIATHASILTCIVSTVSSKTASSPIQRSSTNVLLRSTASVLGFSPVNLRRITT